MKKDLGVKSFLFPCPVAILGTYDEQGSVNAMNMAWGTLIDTNMILCCLTEEHKTCKNLKAGSDLTIAIATKDLVKESDYFGIDSGNTVKDKFARSGLHVVKSQHVNAPVIEEYPLTLECKTHAIRHDEDGNFFVYAEIVNVLADETILNEKGMVDVKKLNAILFSQIDNSYYEVGDIVGKAWNLGLPFRGK